MSKSRGGAARSKSRVSRQQRRALSPARLLQTHRPVARQSLRRLLATPVASITTVFAIAVALLLPALLLGLSNNLGQVLADFQDAARISLYLDDSVAEARGLEVSNDLLTEEAINATAFISREQALLEFGNNAGLAEVLAQLETNPLPATILVQPSAASPDAVEALAGRLGELPEVASVQVDSLWLQRLEALNDLVSLLGRLLGVVVVLGLFIIVGNAIKLAVASREQEIRVVKLVGGSDSYIARPFLYTGLYYGSAGGLLACILQLIVFSILNSSLQDLMGLYDSSFRLRGFGPGAALGLVLGGAFIGWAGALLASLRQIRSIDP